MIVSLIGTLVFYMISFVFLKSVLDFYFAVEVVSFFKILGISIVCWIPFFLYTKIKSCVNPEAHEKLNQTATT